MTPPPAPCWRKPFGMFVLLGAIAAWLVLSATIAGRIGPMPKPVEALVYLVLGIVWIWILPMRRLLNWMETGRWR